MSTPESPKPLSDGPSARSTTLLGVGPGDDKATDQNVVTDRNNPPSREVERLTPHCRKLRVFQMNRNGVVCGVATDCRVLIIENLLAIGIQAQELSERGTADSTINERIIN